MQGIERFSILEFRPHFPGYPGFILLGKTLTIFGLSALEALSFLSVLSALSIPVFATLVVKENRLAVFLFSLTMPLLPMLGLSMLSDGCGIAFFMAAVWQYRKQNMGWCGILLGMVLVCRPSFLIPVGIFILVEMIKQKGALRLVASCTTVCIVFFGAIFAIEGSSLFWEAWRFIEGHFFVWGNTKLGSSQTSWISSLSSYEAGLLYGGIVLASIVYALFHIKKLNDTALIVCVSAWGWTMLFQNPENLRHLALPILLTGLLIGTSMQTKGRNILYVLACLQLFVLVPYISKPVQTSPLVQARTYLVQDKGRKILTNHGVAYLRFKLSDHHVFDAFYDHVLTGGYTRLISGGSEYGNTKKVFSNRVFGEKTFKAYDVE